MTTAEKEKYHEYLCSPEWHVLRNAVMDRDGWRCEKCLYAKAEHVHHKTYIRRYYERLTDLIAVCGPCHEAIHNPKTLTSPAEIVRGRIRDIKKTPLETFERSEAVERYMIEAEQLGMIEEYDQAVNEVTKNLISHEAGAATMSEVLQSKAALISLQRTIDRLKGFSASLPDQRDQYDKM